MITDPIEKDKRLQEISLELQNKINSNLDLIVPKYYNLKSHYFQFKSEIVASTVLTTGKRRYGMWITSKEGVIIPPDHKDALDLKGLEIMKSSMNPIFKKFGEQFLKDILFAKPKPSLDQDIIDFYKTLKNTSPHLLGKPSGVSYINKCIRKKPSSGEIFSELNLNTKENSKSAIYYNDLLRFKGHDKKFESIIEGDKISVVNLKPNPFKIGVIGFPQSQIPEDIQKFIDTYIDRDAIFESMILGKLKELYSDLKWEFVNLNPNVGKYFSF